MEGLMDKVTTQFIPMVLAYAPKVLLALVVLIIGLWIIGRISGVISKALEKSGLDKDIRPFLTSIISVLLKVLLVFAVAEMVGIKTTSFVAILAAASFAIGMALQGSLANFAAGVMIMIFKPYRTGDLINTQGQIGHVKEVQIFNTILTTPDHKTTIIPNSLAISGVVENLSTQEKLRVDLNVNVPYNASFPEVKKVILDAIDRTPKVLSEPAPFVGIESYDSHSIKLAVRPYATTADYWDVYFGTYENVKAALAASGAQVAYPEGVDFGPMGG